MDCSTLGFPVRHQLLELTQTQGRKELDTTEAILHIIKHTEFSKQWVACTLIFKLGLQIWRNEKNNMS